MKTFDFQDYKSSLDLACEPHRSVEYGWVNWTVQTDTPDLVYYQSFNGFGLGWKIHVVDEGEEINHSIKMTSGIVTLIAVVVIHLV